MRYRHLGAVAAAGLLALALLPPTAHAEVKRTGDEPWYQQATADVRADDLGAGQVEPLGRGILAEDDHLVPCAAPFARDRARVDVRTGPFEQVPVPEQDPHPAQARPSPPGHVRCQTPDKSC